MLYNAFPNLEWLKKQAENRFAAGKAWNGEQMPSGGWPNVLLNVKSGATLRDNIPGPLSLFSNVSGESQVTVDGRTTIVKADHFFITNNTQRYTLEIDKNRSAETFNIHFGQAWMNGIVANENVEFYNKLYPKDDVVRSFQSQLKVADKTKLEREELLTLLIVHLLRIDRREKINLESLDAIKISTRQDIIRRIHLATDYIYSFYSHDISLDDLSKVSMLSKFHFLRAFKQVYGTAPHKFLNTVRIEKAKDLLLNSESDVLTISRAIGIKDSSSFSRLFKNTTSVYPTVFRKICHRTG